MYNQETNILLLMLDVSEEEYRQRLYVIAEVWEDRNHQEGIYQHEIFRNWWVLRANNIAKLFFKTFKINNENQYVFHFRNNDGDHFVYGQKEVKKHFFKRLNRLAKTPLDTAMLRILNEELKKIRTK